MIIGKEYKFDACHTLPQHKGKCHNLHGHTWTITIEIDGILDSETGMVMDFYELNRIVKAIIDEYLDHKYLNDLMLNPTCELLCYWLDNELSRHPEFRDLRLRVHSIKIQEGAGGYAWLIK